MYSSKSRAFAVSFAFAILFQALLLGEQFGLTFWRDPATGISHNLRTVIVDAHGRVQKIITENKWTPEELVAEIETAARVEK